MILLFFFFAVEFYERRPKKAWFSKAEEKVCWEQWVLNVTLVTIKTDSGRIIFHPTTSEEVPIDLFSLQTARGPERHLNTNSRKRYSRSLPRLVYGRTISPQ